MVDSESFSLSTITSLISFTRTSVAKVVPLMSFPPSRSKKKKKNPARTYPVYQLHIKVVHLLGSCLTRHADGLPGSLLFYITIPFMKPKGGRWSLQTRQGVVSADFPLCLHIVLQYC